MGASVDEHDAAILFPSKHSGFLPEVKHEVFSDKIQIVVAGVKANHRHLLAPLLDKLLALFGYPFEVRWHVRSHTSNPGLVGLFWFCLDGPRSRTQ